MPPMRLLRPHYGNVPAAQTLHNMSSTRGGHQLPTTLSLRELRRQPPRRHPFLPSMARGMPGSHNYGLLYYGPLQERGASCGQGGNPPGTLLRCSTPRRCPQTCPALPATKTSTIPVTTDTIHSTAPTTRRPYHTNSSYSDPRSPTSVRPTSNPTEHIAYYPTSCGRIFTSRTSSSSRLPTTSRHLASTSPTAWLNTLAHSLYSGIAILFGDATQSIAST
ncbi:hypothetical protein HPB50_015289 [Hyalomma asiaticum]|uniref:Uncharacterized protein n=1 Tax=Hyalomma asiaticum TaxID=266040 RepID=A0ACB7RWF6_HYAAI|nr:hypothetical protein HPB50_015289 [Hyalomma asiaticum]